MEMFFKTLTEYPKDADWMMWTLFILLWILVLAFVFFVVYGLLYLIDSSFRPVNNGVGTIINKVYSPAHTTTNLMYNAALKTSLPVTTYHPDAWYFVIEIDGRKDNFYIQKETFNRIGKGSQIMCKFSTGRIWSSLYVKSIIQF